MAASRSAQPVFRLAGALLAAGCVLFIIGIALYALLPPSISSLARLLNESEVPLTPTMSGGTMTAACD
jgi:hypothetical protein